MDIPVSDMNASQVLSPTVWPTGSKVRLLQVPWDSAYRDVVAWESKEERDAWFAARSGSWYATNFQNLRPGEPVSVPVPYSSVYKYNYLTVTNPQQPVTDEGPERTYFYFITNVEYLSPQATRLTVQLDVMTTYAGSITFGRAYVESGHVGMANANLGAGKPTDGKKLNDYLSLPEGLDCGDTLTPCAREYYNLLPMQSGSSTYVIIVSTANMTESPGTLTNPTLKTAQGHPCDRLVSGCEVYAMEVAEFSNFMAYASDYSWVSQCIICMYAFPKSLTVESFATADKVNLFGKVPAYRVNSGFSRGTNITGDVAVSNSIFDAIAKGLGDDSDVSKMYAYPYSVIELATFTGNPIYLKPQLVDGDKIHLKAIAQALMPFAKAAVFPANYGTHDGDSALKFTFSGVSATGEVNITAGDFLDTAVWITDFPQFSVVNNNYITYMASTAHTRAYSYQNASWQQTRGNLQASGAYATGMNFANMQQENSERSVNAARVNTANNYLASMSNAQEAASGGYVGSALSSISGAAHGASAGGLAGGILGATSGASGVVSTMASQRIAETTASAQRDASNTALTASMLNAQRYGEVSRQNAGIDYNTALAVNKGDYKQAVAAINANVQDAQLTPPSTVGQMGGNGFNWSNGLVGVCITYKTITGAAKSAVSDYFRRYGYAVKRFIELGTVADMLCMTKFAYWRVLESNITCAGANETEREAMRGIMEKGVTLWASPELIGNTDVRTNEVRTDGKQYAF